MDEILKQMENIFLSNINSIKYEQNNLIKKINELENLNEKLSNDNLNLKNIIEELNKEKKAKSSSTIWESMNTKLAEKDNIIEKLKKDVEFYKRTGTKTNIAEKYQANIAKTNTSDESDLFDTKTIKSHANKEIKIEKKINEDKENFTNEIEIIKNIVDTENAENVEVKVKKSKDKEKSEKKKKKKKKIIEENKEDDLDDLEALEKELAGLN